MLMHNHKLEMANAIATFDSQDAAEEAVLGLRIAGFSDSCIGYFARNLAGQITDFLGGSYVVLGTVVGMLLGAALGVCAGRGIVDASATTFWPTFSDGPLGSLIGPASFGTVIVGFCGALIGWGIPRGDAVYLGSEVTAGRYLVAVNARERAGEARAIFHLHGGHEPRPFELGGTRPLPT